MFNFRIFIYFFILLIVFIIGIYYNFTTPDIPIHCKSTVVNGEEKILIDCFPIKSNEFYSDFQIEDTLLAINNISKSNIAQLKRDIIYKHRIGDILMFSILRDNDTLIFPILLNARLSFSKLIFMLEFVSVFLFILLLFLIIFKYDNYVKSQIAIFYTLIVIAYIYSYISFEIPYLYFFLIFSASFLPAIPFSLALYLEKRKKPVYYYPYIGSLILFIVWMWFYMRWAIYLKTEDLKILLNMVPFFILYIAIVGVLGLGWIVKVLFDIFNNNFKFLVYHIIPIFFISFFAFFILYAFPTIFIKKSLLSMDITLLFIHISFLSIIIFYMFYNRETIV